LREGPLPIARKLPFFGTLLLFRAYRRHGQLHGAFPEAVSFLSSPATSPFRALGCPDLPAAALMPHAVDGLKHGVELAVLGRKP
jgi:hypothetical protein